MKGEPPEELDLCGLKCPLPALFTRRALRRSKTGDTVVVLTSDPLAPVDIPHMCWQEGFEVLSIEAKGDCARFLLRRPE